MLHLSSSFQTLGVAAAATSHASGARKSSKGSKENTINLDDTPIRLAVTFASSRAKIMGTQNNYIFNRQPRRMSDALYVMANHGVLLEYALDPIPDSSKSIHVYTYYQGHCNHFR